MKSRLSKKIITFITLTYLIAWSVWIPMAIQGVITRPGIGWPTHLYGLLAPLIAAIITTLIFDGKPGLKTLTQRCFKWQVGYYWLSVIAVIVAAIIALIVTSANINADELFSYSGVATSIGPVATLTLVLAVNGFGEELGWRGFLADELLKKYSLIKTSLFVFAVWAPWHIPLFWVVESFRDFGVGGIIGWLFGILAGSILLVWLYRESKSSILLVAIWHTAFNFTSATDATAEKIAPITSTLVMFAVIAILVFEHRKKRKISHQ